MVSLPPIPLFPIVDVLKNYSIVVVESPNVELDKAIGVNGNVGEDKGKAKVTNIYLIVLVVYKQLVLGSPKTTSMNLLMANRYVKKLVLGEGGIIHISSWLNDS